MVGVVIKLDQSRQHFHISSGVVVGKIAPEPFLQIANKTFCYGRFGVEILLVKMPNVMLF